MKIAIVGTGSMGMAYASAFVKYNLVKREDLTLVSRTEAQAEQWRKSYTNAVTLQEADFSGVDVVVIAVKPQDFKHIYTNWPVRLGKDTLVLSIMAGVTLSFLAEKLNHSLVARAMPNTPAQTGLGMTGYCALPEVDHVHLLNVERLLQTTGRSIFLPDESLMDAVTAVSGSGPAYFFFFVKSLVDAAVGLGFDASVAQLLVRQTMQGAAALIQQSDLTLDELISKVASKGGTTEAALGAFDNGNLKDTITLALKAARDRGQELSKIASGD